MKQDLQGAPFLISKSVLERAEAVDRAASLAVAKASWVGAEAGQHADMPSLTIILAQESCITRGAVGVAPAEAAVRSFGVD